MTYFSEASNTEGGDVIDGKRKMSSGGTGTVDSSTFGVGENLANSLAGARHANHDEIQDEKTINNFVPLVAQIATCVIGR